MARTLTDALTAVAAQRILPVVTIEDARTAKDLGRALNSAGANTVEITFRSKAAVGAIAALAEAGFLVGAGTVRSIDQADAAVGAGASFVVSPGLDHAVVEHCASLGLTAVPGVATASELGEALSLGISTVKLFPAEVIGGVALIRALAAPFPEARFVPTGGLNAENAPEYLALAQVPAIGGSWMVAPSLLTTRNWEEVERLTAEALALGRDS
jgi:2-dehydro-3-deoxyphosphogluconate aldolase / (4S)-4-hydroxy-2-oxoglutarate aldolase